MYVISNCKDYYYDDNNFNFLLDLSCSEILVIRICIPWI